MQSVLPKASRQRCRSVVAQLWLAHLCPHGRQPARLLYLRDFPARMLEQVAISFSRRSPQTQGSDSRLLHWQADSFAEAAPGKPLAHSRHFIKYCKDTPKSINEGYVRLSSPEQNPVPFQQAMSYPLIACPLLVRLVKQAGVGSVTPVYTSMGYRAGSAHVHHILPVKSLWYTEVRAKRMSNNQFYPDDHL